MDSIEVSAKNNYRTTQELMNLRENIITSHPINNIIKHDITSLFKFFELYACFVYDFSGYVCELFSLLQDSHSKSFIYDNLLDEMGYLENEKQSWKKHHSELYRNLVRSMRETEVYKTSISQKETNELEQKSREISDRFYCGHRRILHQNNDSLSIAAFSSIEGWVSKEYHLWQECIANFAETFKTIDTKTISLHCACDIKHSAVLDNLLREFSNKYETQYEVNRGLLHGTFLAERLFSDILVHL